MNDKKKPLKRGRRKVAPEIIFKGLYVRKAEDGSLDFVIPVGIAYCHSMSGDEIPQVLYQKPFKKHVPWVDRYQAVPRGKKYVVNQSYFTQFYQGVIMGDAFHKEFWKEENSGRD